MMGFWEMVPSFESVYHCLEFYDYIRYGFRLMDGMDVLDICMVRNVCVALLVCLCIHNSQCCMWLAVVANREGK